MSSVKSSRLCTYFLLSQSESICPELLTAPPAAAWGSVTVKIENIFFSPPLRVYRHYHLPFLTLIGSLILVWRYLMERGAAMDIRYHDYSAILLARNFMGLKTWCLHWQVGGRALDIRYHNYAANVLAWTPHKTWYPHWQTSYVFILGGKNSMLFFYI